MPTQFLNILPDPDYLITEAGFENSGGDAGPGYASVKLSKLQPDTNEKTLTGKMIFKTNTYFKWLVDIDYNPMTKAQFDPVYSFLMQKRGSRYPFFVSLPQYKVPKDSTFATHVLTNNITTTVNNSAGINYMIVDTNAGGGWDSYPSFGDLFHINDTYDTMHVKAYMVTHVETETTYNTGLGSPGAGYIRLHFAPSLQRYTASGAQLKFHHPLIRVTQRQDLQEYRLDADGLYSFSLSLEEALY